MNAEVCSVAGVLLAAFKANFQNGKFLDLEVGDVVVALTGLL